MYKIFNVDASKCMAKTVHGTQCSRSPLNLNYGYRYCVHHNDKRDRLNGDYQIQLCDGGYEEEDMTLTLHSKMHKIFLFLFKFQGNVSHVNNCKIKFSIIGIEAELAIHHNQSPISIIDISDSDSESDNSESVSVSSIDSDSNCPEEWGITEDCACDRCASARAQWCFDSKVCEEEEENLYPHQCGVCLKGAVVYRPICCDKKQNLCEACWTKCVETKKGCPFCRSQSFVGLFEFLKDQYLVSSVV